MSRLVLALIAIVAIAGDSIAQTAVERGNYLVNVVLSCGNCHTPRGPGGVFDMSKQLSGGPQTFDEPTFKAKGANITPDMETGIGSWSAGDIKTAITTGVRPNGVPLAPVMPFGFYKVFLPEDLDAVVAYLKSVPAVRNEVEIPTYKAEMHIDVMPGAEKPMSQVDMGDQAKRGFYLATIAHCMECHTPVVNDRWNYKDDLGKGGRTYRGPFGESVSRNITSHKTKGIGAWSDAEIKRAITQGISQDGRKMKPPMAYSLYARLTDADLDAIVAYIRLVTQQE